MVADDSPESSARSTARFSFVDPPKLSLDQLLEQMIDRARDVQQAQGRLRALLRAVESVTQSLSLDAVLRNIVESACDLASARYAAVGVTSADGELEDFITVGIDDATRARIGAPPRGRGLLGSLNTDSAPTRLRRMSDDPRSVGFPAGHPAMESFLGVPIRARGEVLGNLYLAESERGEFTVEDEELVVALAAAAGHAIANARRFDEATRQQRWLAASLEITARLFTSEGADPLHLVVRRAGEVADADFAAVTVLDAEEFVVAEAVGPGTDALIGRRFAADQTLAGLVVRTGQPLLFGEVASDGADGAADGDTRRRRAHLLDVVDAGPTMIVPIGGVEQLRGSLTLVRTRGRPSFTPADLGMAAGFAGHASVALELAAARRSEKRMVLLEDRDRIARDLHDHVIQELFAVGLGVESVANVIGKDTPEGRRLRQRVEDVDRTIRQIRTTIFELRGPLDRHDAPAIRQLVVEVVDELAPHLGYRPAVTFRGLVDLIDDPGLAADVTAVVRESLTNVVKHARASRVEVSVELADGELGVVVADNGIGMSAATRSSGIANLAARAERRGGRATAASAGAGGTEASWRVPVTGRAGGDSSPRGPGSNGTGRSGRRTGS